MAKKTRVYTGTQWVDLASSITDLSQYANLNTTPISGFRNAIINGDFRINQRGITSTGVTAGGYFLDRWRMDGSTGTITASVQSFTPGNQISGYEPTQHSRIAVTGQSVTTAYATTSQKIEDVRTFAGQTITISFWAKATSGTPNISIELSQNFGTGGSPSSQVNTYVDKFALSTSWTRYTETITVPSISGKTIGSTANTSYLELRVWCSAGSDFNARTNSLGNQNNTFDFWGFQVEKGSTATPFEQRPIGTELALCQRYFQVPQSQLAFYYNSSNSSGELKLQQTMRAIPQLAVTGATVFQHTIGIQSGNITPISIGFTNSGTVTGGQLTFNQNATLASMATNTYYVIQSPFFTCSAEL